MLWAAVYGLPIWNNNKKATQKEHHRLQTISSIHSMRKGKNTWNIRGTASVDIDKKVTYLLLRWLLDVLFTEVAIEWKWKMWEWHWAQGARFVCQIHMALCLVSRKKPSVEQCRFSEYTDMPDYALRGDIRRLFGVGKWDTNWCDLKYFFLLRESSF